MEKTAVVINAGLGDLSLGLSMAGFTVAAAFEADEKAIRLHAANLPAPVFPVSGLNLDKLPEAELLAARLSDPQDGGNIRKYLIRRRPRAFLLLFPSSQVMQEQLAALRSSGALKGYSLFWQKMDVAQMTGMPVRESLFCAVGFGDMAARFTFPSAPFTSTTEPETFLQAREAVDFWYDRVDAEVPGDVPGVYCWKSNHNRYEKVETVQWNYWKVPLVRDSGGLRKMTHREIANLKAFPETYALSDDKYRQWLYTKLIYAENIGAIRMLADAVMQTLEPNPWRAQHFDREQLFENLFYEYLEKARQSAASEVSIQRRPGLGESYADFLVPQEDGQFLFELKWYHKKVLPESALHTLCAKQASLLRGGKPVLVFANVVPEKLKEACLEKYGVAVWDIGNLLWLFDAYPDIKNELIAALGFSVDDIVPEQPAQVLFPRTGEKKAPEKDSWEKKLRTIAPGKAAFREYEEVCTDILKYVLGDYLTLWEKQEPSSDGLYRFDLCCKIKSGVEQDFFDTVKTYFNTKYIVFEFKNYSDRITQKEIYTTEKYLYEKALRKVAVIVSRFGADENAMKAVRGCLRETGKLILCLSDSALLDMVKIKEQGEREPAEFLDTVLDDMLVHLEK